MRIVCLICIVVFLVCSFGAFAQGAYLEKGQNGFGGEVRLMWSQDGFRGLGVVTGYSIAGILDIGFDLGYTLGEVGGTSASELGIGFAYKANVLKQSPRIPLSLQIMGSYGLVNVSSDYLNANDLIRRATGYTIGVDLSRNFRLTSYWLLRMNVLVDYQSFTYTDTDTSVAPPVVAAQEHIGNLFFGGGLGFLFVFPMGSTLAVQAELRANQDLELQIHPIIALAFPQK